MRDPARRLFFASFAMLFIELALIRWIAAYVVYVAYFTNFVLLASFLGIGVGFLRADATSRPHAMGPGRGRRVGGSGLRARGGGGPIGRGATVHRPVRCTGAP